MGFRLGLAQCCHPENGNVVGMVEAWACRAEAEGVELLVFPESLMTPFDASPEEFATAAEPLDGPFCTAVNEIAAKYGLWMVYTANELNANGKPPFNTAVVVDEAGTQRAVYRKVHLFDTNFIKESAKVSAGSELICAVEAPFGTFGVCICYDLRFPEQARALAVAGCQLIVYPAAWVDGTHKVNQWRTLLAARAVENEVFVAGLSRCDRAFGAGRRNYAGHSCVFSPLGEELASAELEQELLIADIDFGAVASARAAMPILEHRRVDLYE